MEEVLGVGPKPPGRASGCEANFRGGTMAVLQLPCPSHDAIGPKKTYRIDLHWERDVCTSVDHIFFR